MAENKTADPNAETDEYGRAIHRYESMVLVVVPSAAYAEETLRYARSCLYNVHVGTRCVARESDELIRGRLQDEFLADEPLSQAKMADYSGVLFVGGEGARELADDPDALRLAREAQADGKLIGAWGDAVAVLARADVVKRRKVTGSPALAEELRRAGAKYTGSQVQRDGNVVTALDDAAGMRFGKALVAFVAI